MSGTTHYLTFINKNCFLIFHFRKHQWIKLSRKTPFTFLSVAHLVELNINFKDACKRIWKILVNEVSERNILFVLRDVVLLNDINYKFRSQSCHIDV